MVPSAATGGAAHGAPVDELRDDTVWVPPVLMKIDPAPDPTASRSGEQLLFRNQARAGVGRDRSRDPVQPDPTASAGGLFVEAARRSHYAHLSHSDLPSD